MAEQPYTTLFIEETPIQRISHSALSSFDGELWIQRDDLIHPEVSGNKWRKLKEQVLKAIQNKNEGILTFGGAYSNHIAATAKVGALLKIPTIGLIRGDELNKNSNQTLSQASKDGMQLVFVSREEYQLKTDYAYQKQLKKQFGQVVIVGEGGKGFYGMNGTMEITKNKHEFDDFVVSCGTGTTAAGMLLAMQSHQHLHCYPALKGDWLREEINNMMGTYFMSEQARLEYNDDFSVHNQFHFGGYAKYSDELIQFMRTFHLETGIKLDALYTAKMMFGLFETINKTETFTGKKILAIHTGGLQGNIGIETVLGGKIFFD